RDDLVKKSFSMGLWMVLITSCLQVVIGDHHGLNTLKHQPAKLAAIEGHWETNRDHAMPLLLFAIPDMENERNTTELGIPYLGSLILTHSLDGQVTGLKDFAAEDRPNVPIVFWSFRVMVSLGMLMVLLSLTALWLRKKGSLYESSWFHKFAIIMGPTGYVALLAGWVTTEVGRQPWVVYGVMRTRDGLSHSVTADQVGLSLIIFVLVYTVVFGSGIYYMLKLIKTGPAFLDSLQPEKTAGLGHFKTPLRPLSAVDEMLDDQASTTDQAKEKHHD
ncbi:MAG: cytochrome ubiquinol oxidase subunit I, partial [Pseudomonas sp.]